MYRLLNESPGLVCERVFQTLERSKKNVAGPPLSLESQRRVEEFATLAFSLSFEADYLDMINLLRRASISPLAEDRDDTYPLPLAGPLSVPILHRWLS